MSRDNLLRTIYFEKPEYIPMQFHINAACWHHYPQDALQELMISHPLLFPDFEPPPTPIQPEYAPDARRDEKYIDSWGCVWETTDNGITGTVTEHPLESWENFNTFTAPNPKKENGFTTIDWNDIRIDFANAQANDRLAQGSLIHGHTFLMLSYIRGYENLIYDMADAEPRLVKLLEMLEDFNLTIVKRYLQRGAEMMGFPEDLGMQVGPMLSVAHFRKYINPVYRRLMAPAKAAGCIIHQHSDGDIRDLAFDLIEDGVQIINLQDLVNGIEWIKKNLAGKICIDLDLDRQNITCFGTPNQIDEFIRMEIQELGSPAGGLMFIFGLYPGVPLENVKAIMDAMEKYAGYFR